MNMMMRKLQQITALTLVLSVLVSSHTFAWFEHRCTITDITTFSFTPETCAGEVVDRDITATTLQKGYCCEISFQINQADDAVNHAVAFASALWEVTSISVYVFNAPALDLAGTKTLAFADSSPPRSQALYILNQQFII